jgi:NhaP-type Na+/H+ or K+/H+ antiporter
LGSRRFALGDAGIVMGIIVAKAVIWCDHKLQKRRRADEIMEDFIALSTILLAYSLTELVNGYGFLAVFVAGVVVQKKYFTNQDKRMAQLEFAEQLEKLLEITVVVLLGTMLLINPMIEYAWQSIAIAFCLFVLIRPIGVWLFNLNGYLPRPTQYLIGWFGIRGIGSIYYLAYALGEGISGNIAEQISWITFTVITISVVIHGISALPLMNWYEGKN